MEFLIRFRNLVFSFFLNTVYYIAICLFEGLALVIARPKKTHQGLHLSYIEPIKIEVLHPEWLVSSFFSDRF